MSERHECEFQYGPLDLAVGIVQEWTDEKGKCVQRAFEKLGGKCVAILDARHAPGVFSQFLRCRARPCANFKNMFAQIRAGQKPRNYLLPRHAPPVRRSTKPVLKPIQSNTSRPPRGRVSRKVLKEELFFQDLIIAGLRKI